MQDKHNNEQKPQRPDQTEASANFETPGPLLEEASDAFHIISDKGIIMWANKKELELMGYSKEEYIGHHISEFYADRFVINDILCRLIYNQEVTNYPAELIRKDGTKIQALLNSKAYQKDGKFLHASSSTTDISELKIFQTRLENSNALVLNKLLNANTLLNLVSSVAWVTDYQGYIVTPQVKWQLYTGQEFNDAANYGWLKAFHPDDRIAIKANLLAAIRDNHDFKQSCRVFKKSNNTYQYCGIFATPMISLQNHTFEWSFILVDQTKIIPPGMY